MKTDTDYLNFLIEQYKKARGNELDLDSKLSLIDFRDWLYQMTLITKEYKNILLSNFDINNSNSIEIGKGIYDTIATTDLNIRVATPFSLKNNIKMEFVMIGNQPFYKFYGTGTTNLVKIDDFNKTFLTHNPYFENDILNWEVLNNIIVGVYGSNNDKDKEFKINLIRELKNKINNQEYIDYLDDTYDSYCYFIAPKQKKYSYK